MHMSSCGSTGKAQLELFVELSSMHVHPHAFIDVLPHVSLYTRVSRGEINLPNVPTAEQSYPHPFAERIHRQARERQTLASCVSVSHMNSTFVLLATTLPCKKASPTLPRQKPTAPTHCQQASNRVYHQTKPTTYPVHLLNRSRRPFPPSTSPEPPQTTQRRWRTIRSPNSAAATKKGIASATLPATTSPDGCTGVRHVTAVRRTYRGRRRTKCDETKPMLMLSPIDGTVSAKRSQQSQGFIRF